MIELGATAIDDSSLGSTTEGSKSYTTGAMSTATKLPLTMRETPQAVTVITRQRMDDQGMTSINDVARYTPGLFLNQSNGPGRQTYKARGFDVDNIMYDGIPSAYTGWVVGAQPNLAMFDRVEVVRGATGLVTGSGTPSAAINLVRKRPLAEQKVTLTGAAGAGTTTAANWTPPARSTTAAPCVAAWWPHIGMPTASVTASRKTTGCSTR